MNAFDIAWSLLKEDDTMQFEEIKPKFKQTILPTGDNPLVDNLRQRFAGPPSKIDREFAEGLARRMDTSPPKKPTRVKRVPEGSWGNKYVLEDDEGKKYSKVAGQELNPDYFKQRFGITTINPTLSNIMGATMSGEERKGHYEKLLNTLLQNNINIRSSSRNYASEPFHQKFQRRLAPNIDMQTRHNSVGRPDFVYMKDPIKDSKAQAVRDVQGWGDLQPDYNTLPLVDLQDTIKPRLSDLTQEHKGTEQLRLGERAFLASSNPENPMHNIHEMMFRTPSGKPYSTQHVLMDKYNPDYEDHPYHQGLGILFG
jgi:hypothetical protein